MFGIIGVLTKRSRCLRDLSPSLPWAPNIWMGVSVENANYTFRFDDLRATGAAIKFLSLEPLLGPLTNLDLTGIDWVIVGGESGPGARPMDAYWVRDIREQCVRVDVPFSSGSGGTFGTTRIGTIRPRNRAAEPPRAGGCWTDEFGMRCLTPRQRK